MKRMLTAVLALLLALSLCACGAQDTDDTPTYPAAFSGLETLIDTARDEGRLTVCGTGDEAYMTALCEKLLDQAPMVPVCFKSYSVLLPAGAASSPITPTASNPFYGISDWKLNMK